MLCHFGTFGLLFLPRARAFEENASHRKHSLFYHFLGDDFGMAGMGVREIIIGRTPSRTLP